ncbi:flagellar type III secretion system pore protein FliP [Sedimentibacter hydroxybenzoicus]
MSKKEPKTINKVKLIKIYNIVMILVLMNAQTAYGGVINMDINGNAAETVEILVMLTVLTLLPSILIMMTAFTRIMIVLSFLKNAMGLQQTPPNQVLIGIAIFLTLFIMSPVINEINTEAYQPYKNEEITQQEFYERASGPIKVWMLKQTNNDELQMFVDMSNDQEISNAESVNDLPLTVIIPSFVTSELKRAFIIGFLLYIPFLIIDLIVSSVLMSMGMMMLPPIMISMPFKILLFVVVDGWSLLFKTLITTFNF